MDQGGVNVTVDVSIAITPPASEYESESSLSSQETRNEGVISDTITMKVNVHHFNGYDVTDHNSCVFQGASDLAVLVEKCPSVILLVAEVGIYIFRVNFE